MTAAVLFKSETVEWATPRAVYDKLNAEFAFNFDPCPIGGTEDGLASLFVSWAGKRVFCNPPYGPEIRKWLERGLDAEIAVYLIPVRTDTRWFHELVIPRAAEIRFIKGRLKFGDAVNSAPFPSMLVIFRAEIDAAGKEGVPLVTSPTTPTTARSRAAGSRRSAARAIGSHRVWRPSRRWMITSTTPPLKIYRTRGDDLRNSS